MKFTNSHKHKSVPLQKFFGTETKKPSTENNDTSVMVCLPQFLGPADV